MRYPDRFDALNAPDLVEQDYCTHCDAETSDLEQVGDHEFLCSDCLADAMAPETTPVHVTYHALAA